MRNIGSAIIITVVICAAILAYNSVTPIINITPEKADVGTNFKLDIFLFRPFEKITIDVLRISDNQTIKTIDLVTNLIGLTSYEFSTSSFSAGDYNVNVNDKHKESIKTLFFKLTQSNGPPHTEPPGVKDLIIEPSIIDVGDTIKVKIQSLRPHQIISVKIVYCLNDICNKTKLVYSRASEQEFTDAHGNLTTYIETDNRWEKGRYIVTADDGLTAKWGEFDISEHPQCSCQGIDECGSEDCCAPNFKLSSLSGETITFCHEYGNALSPQPVLWINFWNASCPGCNEYMKIIQKIKDTWHPGELKIFTINSGESLSEVTKFLDDRHYDFYTNINYPVLFDTDRSIKGRFQPGGDPCHYFIDKNGKIRVTKYGYGSIQSEGEVRAIVQYINEKFNR